MSYFEIHVCCEMITTVKLTFHHVLTAILTSLCLETFLMSQIKKNNTKIKKTKPKKTLEKKNVLSISLPESG